MDSCAHALDGADPEAVAFVRFCRARRRVGWPELYDEMWAVASRGLFRGYSFVELEGLGIGFSLFGTPRLARLAAAVIEEERASALDARARERGPERAAATASPA